MSAISAITAILAISRHPAPPPGFDPIRPKVTQFDPMPGSPTRAFFAWWGGRLRASAEGRKSDHGDHVRSHDLGALCAPPPPPLIPISKGLTRLIPIYPHEPVLTINGLHHSSPSHPHFDRWGLWPSGFASAVVFG